MGFRNTFNRMITAREKQFSRYVNGALLNLNDETLKNAGLTREELRNKGASTYPY